MTRNSRVLCALALIAVTVAAYWPVSQCGFIWDDDDYVTQNESLTSAAGLGRIWAEIGATPQYYPLVFTSFWLEQRLWGSNPTGYHAINLLLHVSSALLLWYVLVRLGFPAWVSWAAAVVFAVHPVHVETVAWITERKNVLSGLLYLAALGTYFQFSPPGAIGGQTGPRRYYFAALLLFIAALLSKTVTATLPAAILMLLWWQQGRVSRVEILRMLPFFAIGLALGLITLWIEKHHVGTTGTEWNLTWVERFLVAGRALWFYPAKLLWPASLSFVYPRWEIDTAEIGQYVFPLCAISATVGLWLLRDRLGRGPLAAALLYAGTLAPALGFFDVYPMRYSFVADHFVYLASVPLIVVVVVTLHHGRDHLGVSLRRMSIVAGVAALFTLGALTSERIAAFRSVESLWRDTLAKNPAAWLAHNNLGIILQERGEMEDAVQCFREAVRLNSDFTLARFNLAGAHLLDGNVSAAIAEYEELLSRDPDIAQAHSNLGQALVSVGKVDEGIKHLRQAIDLQPRLASAYLNLGLALRHHDDTEGAIEQFRWAIRIRNDYPEAHFNLANSLKERGQNDEALRHYRRAIEIRPSYAKAHFNLANALIQAGNATEGMEHYRAALDADPKFLEAQVALGAVLVKVGRPLEAVDSYVNAYRLRPDLVVAANEAAWILSTHHDPNVRDANQAIQLAESAVRNGNATNPMVLDTLAAAYAAAGRFDDAVRTAERALLQIEPENQSLGPQVRQRLHLYRNARPYRACPFE